MSKDSIALALAAVAFLLSSISLLAWQINNERPSCFCDPAVQGQKGEKGDVGPAGPQGEPGPRGEPGEPCECDLEHVATKLELATVAIESRTAIIALRQRLAELERGCEPTPAKPGHEVLPTPEAEPESRVKVFKLLRCR